MQEVAVPGRQIPIGYARYKDPVVDPANYSYVRMANWRVAVPTTMPERRRGQIVEQIYRYGPQSAGYVRLGDTLVPASLGPGNRMTLAETAIDYEDFPLSI